LEKNSDDDERRKNRLGREKMRVVPSVRVEGPRERRRTLYLESLSSSWSCSAAMASLCFSRSPLSNVVSLSPAPPGANWLAKSSSIPLPVTPVSERNSAAETLKGKVTSA
jgi:hypothetical protein